MEKKREKENEGKKILYDLINVILFDKNLANSERVPKITENREYYMEEECEIGF